MSLPVLLNVMGKRCLTVGGGTVAMRKARALLSHGAEVTILSPSLKTPLADVQHIPEHYSRERLLELKPWLVVAATNREEVNQTICDDARAAGILVESMDNPRLGDIRGMVSQTRQNVTIAVAAGSPHFSRYLAEQFADQLAPELLTLLDWLRILRPHLKDHIAEQSARAGVWEAVFESSQSILDSLRQGDATAAKGALAGILGDWIHPYLPESPAT
jgi:precorrin-2 dehydrogenase/sirohydrochlorin ferrochelatase